MYQQITLLGRVGQDVEQRYTPSGKAVANLSLAVDKGYGDKKKTMWFRVALWDKDAENAAKYVAKGMTVLVTGELEEPRTWTDKSGETRVSLEVTARQIKYVGNVTPKEPTINMDEVGEIPF